MDDDLNDMSERLRAMMSRSENATRRAEVLAALRSKHEGTQSCALQVLGAWGSETATNALREFLVAAFGRKYSVAVRGVAVKALVPWTTADDAEWVLGLYFKIPGVLAKHELLPLVIKLPPETARARLVKHLSDPDPANRQAAAKAIGNMSFVDRNTLLRRLVDDPDDFVRKSVGLILQASGTRTGKPR